MVSLKRKAVSICCALTLVTSLVPVSALAEEDNRAGFSYEVVSQEERFEGTSIATEYVDLTDTYNFKDAVVRSVSDDGSIIAPFSLDGDEVSDKVSEAYDYISGAVKAHPSSVDLSSLSITVAELRDAMDLVLCNPEVWWLRLEYSYSLKKDKPDQMDCTAIALVPKYLYNAAETEALQIEVESSVAEALSWIDPAWSDFDKAQVLHDYLVRTCQYSLQVASGGSSEPAFHSAVSALTGSKTTVCQGYALAYKLLLKRCGIDAVYVSSREMSHGWNLVNLDGAWYHVDVTWDDPVYRNPQGGIYNQGFDAEVKHTYFLKGDQTFRTMEKPHAGWATSLLAPMDYTLSSDFAYPTYKGPTDWDCTALGHRDPVVEKEDVCEATCLEEGSYEAVFRCPSCSNEVNRRIVTLPKRSHTPGPTVRENECEATCVESGSYDEVVRCATCNTEISRSQNSVAALGHQFSNYVSNGDAQIGVDGTKTATCSRCGAKRTIADEGSALPSPSEPETPEKPETPSTPAQPTVPSNPSTGSTTAPTVKPSTPAPPSSGSSTTTKPAPTPTPTPSKPVTSPPAPAKPTAKAAAKAPTFKKTKISKLKSSKKKTLTVTWKKATKSPVKYQVQYSTDKKFKKA